MARKEKDSKGSKKADLTWEGLGENMRKRDKLYGGRGKEASKLNLNKSETENYMYGTDEDREYWKKHPKN